ncbi:MAG: hypothetical protein F4Y64_10680 [Rhodothermaceae bacterium]|nr:hypothetical protein [Rhodothermaceae bacterium]MXZ57698.1 hypothetical protein [Rhodothermaceae bacterium]
MDLTIDPVVFHLLIVLPTLATLAIAKTQGRNLIRWKVFDLIFGLFAARCVDHAPYHARHEYRLDA